MPAVEQHLHRAGRLVVLHRHEEKIRGGADPDAAEADFQAADEVQAFHEDGAFVEMAVAVGVLEDDDAVAFRALVFRQEKAGRRMTARIDVGLGHPHAAAVVDRHGDGLFDVRLAGKRRDGKAFRQRHGPGGLVGGQSREFERVGDVPRTGVREIRFRLVEFEVVEIEMSPAARAAIDQANENIFAEMVFKIHHHRPQIFNFDARGFEEAFEEEKRTGRKGN